MTAQPMLQAGKSKELIQEFDKALFTEYLNKFRIENASRNFPGDEELLWGKREQAEKIS